MSSVFLDRHLDTDSTSQLDEHDTRTCMSHQYMERLYDMHLNNTFCDATINVTECSFDVHRAVMCSSSEYFRALFSNSIKNERSSVSIPGIRGPIMRQILLYAYKRQCDIDDDNVHELLTIADYVGMLGLVNLCKKRLVKMMTPQNCIGIMLFARLHLLEDLYTKSRTYIMINFVEISNKSDEILKISLKDFFDIISDDVLNARDEENVWKACIRWIDYDPDQRKSCIAKLLSGIRLALIENRFFMETVREHPYVVDCIETRPLLIETLKFIYDLGDISMKDEVRTPPVAIPRLPHEVIFAMGGWSEGRARPCIETYDTRADRWVRITEEDPAGPRAYHGTAVIGYKIYCIGGFDGTEYFNTCRMFDAVQKTWKEISPMHCRRCYISVAVLGGLIYAMGGYDGHNRQNTVERYDPRTNQWTMITPMNMQRSDASACTLNGKIFITGGFNGTECMNSAEYYDLEENTWTQIPNMISRRSGVSCVAYQGHIYVVGGFNGLSRISSGERFDPEAGTWTAIREMYHPRSNFGLEVIDGLILAAGGFNGAETISHTECYDPEVDEWLEATSMSMVRSALSIGVICGLPNMEDYIHKDRTKLMEEARRMRMTNNFLLNPPEEEMATIPEVASVDNMDWQIIPNVPAQPVQENNPNPDRQPGPVANDRRNPPNNNNTTTRAGLARRRRA